MWQAWDLAVDMALSQLPSILENDTPYRASTFFEEQLTAFEVWLKYGNEKRPPPEQLPIVLQVCFCSIPINMLYRRNINTGHLPIVLQVFLGFLF